MKVQLTLDDFPMKYLNKMILELTDYLDNIDVQVGGQSTVFVAFTSDDIVKVQQVSIICDRYTFADNDDEKEMCED